MGDKTKIVFSNGHELTVDEEPSEVLDRLSTRERFPSPRFRKTSDGVDVYVMADHVAYIAQVPQLSMGTPPEGGSFSAETPGNRGI